MHIGQEAPLSHTATPTRRRHAIRKALGRMRASPSMVEGTAVTQAPACGWLIRFNLCLSRTVEAEETRPARSDLSKEKDDSCWEGEGAGEEDQPRRGPQEENTSERLALRLRSREVRLV